MCWFSGESRSNSYHFVERNRAIGKSYGSEDETDSIIPDWDQLQYTVVNFIVLNLDLTWWKCCAAAIEAYWTGRRMHDVAGAEKNFVRSTSSRLRRYLCGNILTVMKSCLWLGSAPMRGAVWETWFCNELRVLTSSDSIEGDDNLHPRDASYR